MMELEEGDGWILLVTRYLTVEHLLNDEPEAKKIKRLSTLYIRMVEKLYKMDQATLYERLQVHGNAKK